MTVEKLMTARQVAEAFDFPSPKWVLEQARRENDPMPRFLFGDKGGAVRFRASEIEAWLERQRVKGSDRAS
jgi:hypothetical protein